ncbi:MAG: nucleotidyltransferase domain-containing protein [Candidatus Aenigmarchaeota archaeon]|nr:nucleotidyltransferase domain-containing protein [Candidatus Aenigmarchaeota archaeon]
MEIKFDILKPFFECPNRGYTIRGIAKITKINHTTVRKYLVYYAKSGLIAKKQAVPYITFTANTNSKKYINLKLYYNLELIRESGLVEKIEKAYNYPPIVLFGSFSKAENNENSDIDICIVSDIKKGMDLSEIEKKMSKKASIRQFTDKAWKEAKKKNPELVNNIANGITLSGQLEIL